MDDPRFAEWVAEYNRMVGHVFSTPAEKFAREWRAGRIGTIEELETSGNWQDELMARLGRMLDEAMSGPLPRRAGEGESPV
jgi:hypothetical protein